MGASMIKPLSEAELEWLAETMEQIQQNTEEGMSLSMADGFFTALALAPTAVCSTEWLSWVLAEELDVADAQTEQRLLSLLMRQFNRVQYVIRQQQPPEFEPVFLYQADSEKPWVAEWCHGFIAGVNIAQTSWQFAMPREEDAITLELLVGMSTLLPPDVDARFYAVIDAEEEDEAGQMARQMRAAAFDALDTYRLKFDPNAQWEQLLEVCVMSLRDQLLHPETIAELCPCDSGKAFTDCCGGSDRQLH
jgi:uncharacterized protein